MRLQGSQFKVSLALTCSNFSFKNFFQSKFTFYSILSKAYLGRFILSIVGLEPLQPSPVFDTISWFEFHLSPSSLPLSLKGISSAYIPDSAIIFLKIQRLQLNVLFGTILFMWLTLTSIFFVEISLSSNLDFVLCWLRTRSRINVRRLHILSDINFLSCLETIQSKFSTAILSACTSDDAIASQTTGIS